MTYVCIICRAEQPLGRPVSDQRYPSWRRVLHEQTIAGER